MLTTMAYSAKQIPLLCHEHVVRDWAMFIRAHADDVAIGLWQEGTCHELWYLGRDAVGLFVIGVMDTGVPPPPCPEWLPSSLPLIGQTHRDFKTHWDRDRVRDLPIDHDAAPDFPGCELLLDLRASEPSDG